MRLAASARRLRPLLLAMGLLAAAPVRAGEREVRLDGGSGPLVGALATPDAPGPGRPAALLLAGSGPVDRNGDILRAGFRGDDLRLIARALEAAGYASLRADKRCIGDSLLACPGEAKLTIGVYADDAARWARFLQSQPGVRCVVLLGHSEGALVAALAAAEVPVCGVISVSGVGRPLDQVIVEQVKAAGAGPVVIEKVTAMNAELKAGRSIADVPPALSVLYRPAVQPFLRSEFAVDPAAALGAVRAPVLILQGANDLQVGVEDARRLAAARPGARLVVLEGVNHVLKAAPADRSANVATYSVDLPLAPGVMPPILDFLRGLPAAGAAR